MTIATVQFRSKALERDAVYIALIPDPAIVGPGPYPMLIQLHGYLDDHTAWLYKSRLLEYVERYPLITILPATSNGWWANLGRPNDWEDYIVQDLIAHTSATFPVRPGPLAIGGLSMGGYGAMRLALKHPGIFHSVWSHSSAFVSPDQPAAFPFLWDEPDRSEQARTRFKTDLDPYHWARQLTATAAPRISFDCGTEDFLIGQNRAFHAFLTSIDIPHQYAEHPGGHTWEYWDRHVQSALLQHADVLGITQAPEPVWGV